MHSNQIEMSTIYDIPKEVLEYIFSYLNARAISKIALTCKIFYVASLNDALWNLKIQQNFPNRPSQNLNGKNLETFKKYYQKKYPNRNGFLFYWIEEDKIEEISIFKKNYWSALSLDDFFSVQDSAGKSLFKYAIEFKSQKILDHIYGLAKKNFVVNKNKIDIHKFDHYGEFLLFWAAWTNQIEQIPLLITAGANVDQTCTRDGATALYIASQEGHSDVVKELLNAKASIDLPCTNDHETPLFIAASNGHLKVVEVLLDKKAKVDLPNNRGESPLLAAIFKGYSDVVKALLDANASIDLENNAETPLCVASLKGHIDIVKALLNKGAQVNQIGKCGLTPIWLASKYGHSDVVTELLIKGAQVNQKDSLKTKLWVASFFCNLEIVNALLLKGSILEKMDFSDMNLLYFKIRNKLINTKKVDPILPVTEETKSYPNIIINVSLIFILEKEYQILSRKSQAKKATAIRELIDLIYTSYNKPFSYAVEFWKKSHNSIHTDEKNWEIIKIRDNYYSPFITSMLGWFSSNANKSVDESDASETAKLINKLLTYTQQFTACQGEQTMSGSVAKKEIETKNPANKF